MKKNRLKILCTFGKYQYGKKERGLNTEFFSFVPAFRTLNHEVIFFDSWDRTLFSGFKDLNRALVEKVEQEVPDLIFSVQMGYEIWIETWDYIRQNYSCKTINWCTDDSWKFKEHSKFLANHFDLMVTTYEEFLARYDAIGATAILSGWAAPVQWLRPPITANACQFDVTFIGAAHGNRKERVEKLKQAGIAIECFGYGWENGPVDAEKIPEIFNHAVISLNFANSHGENQIKARTFEVPGSGGFLLTEDAKNLQSYYADGAEIAVFDSDDTCLEKIRYYLENTKVRDDIAMAGYEKTKSHYTYANRLQHIIETVSECKRRPVATRETFEEIMSRHTHPAYLTLFKNILTGVGTLMFGKKRGKRFARRLAYEISWRVCRKNTYRASGVVGRMFYDE